MPYPATASPGSRTTWTGFAWHALPILVLLTAVGVSYANGFINGVLAYERDTSVFYYPLFEWASQQLHNGQFPLWCPQMLGGYPLFADSELGLASPAVLAAMLALPADTAFVVLRVFFVSVAALGAYALARAWRLSRTAGVVAGLTFSLGSFLPAHIPHENVVRTAAWLPVTLACLEFAVRSRARMRRRWIVAGSASMGFAALGLHPEILLVNLLSVAAYAVLRTGVSTRLQVIRIVAAMMFTGLSLAAVQLVPLAELGPLSARAGAFPYSEVVGQSFTPFGLVQLVLPYVFRGPGSQQWGLWTHWESYLYVGLLPLVLVCAACARWRRPAIRLWVVIGLGGLVVALGQYSPVDVFWLLWRLPGLGWLRAPGRFELTVVLALAMLAAHGMQILQVAVRRAPNPRLPSLLRLSVVSTALALPLVFALGLTLAHSALLDEHDLTLQLVQAHYLSLPHDQPALSAEDVYAGLLRTTDMSEPRVAGAVVGLFATVVTIILWQRAPATWLRRWSGWSAALILISAVDLLAFGWSIHPRQALSVLATPDPAIASVHQLLLSQDASGAPARVMASPVVQQIAPDRLVPLGVQEAGGYSSLDTSSERSLLLRVERVDDDLLDLSNVKYVLDPGTYGSLPTYRDVQYSPRNPLVDAGSGGDLGDETFGLPAPIKATELRVVSALEEAADVEQATPVADIVLRTHSGAVVVRATLRAGEHVMDWSWDDLAHSVQVRHKLVEVAGDVPDKLTDGQVVHRTLSFASLAVAATNAIDTIEITTATPRGRLAIFGVGVVDSDGAVHQLFGRQKTKYREVMRDQTVRVLENTAVFPRAFLVPRARIAAPGTSLEMMQGRPFEPRNEVILASDSQAARLTPAMLPLSLGSSHDSEGNVWITRYSPLEVDMDVTAPSPAFLVLTDAFYPGWQALVDGRQSPIMRGDLMFRVVALAPGQHSVAFLFAPISVTLGLAISVVTLLVCLAVLIAELAQTFACTLAGRRAACQ